MSKWIDFVKEFASKNNMSYRDALRSPKLKEEYSKTKATGGGNKVGYVTAKQVMADFDSLRDPIPIAENPGAAPFQNREQEYQELLAEQREEERQADLRREKEDLKQIKKLHKSEMARINKKSRRKIYVGGKITGRLIRLL